MNCPFCVSDKLRKKEISLNDIKIELGIRKYKLATLEQDKRPIFSK